MSQTRARLRPLVRALERAHHELDDAMREHIRREPDA
jgi:exonuclease VII small subunit